MLNKIASNYLEKIAFQDTIKDMARSIPAGIADFGLSTAEDTLVPSGRFGYKFGGLVMSPIVGLKGLTNGKGWYNTSKKYMQDVNKWADKAYQNVNKDIIRDRQAVNKALPTLTRAGVNTRKFAEVSASMSTGIALGGPSRLFTKTMAAANAIKSPFLRRGVKMLSWLTDKLGTDDVAYKLNRLGDRLSSR